MNLYINSNYNFKIKILLKKKIIVKLNLVKLNKTYIIYYKF